MFDNFEYLVLVLIINFCKCGDKVLSFGVFEFG